MRSRVVFVLLFCCMSLAFVPTVSAMAFVEGFEACAVNDFSPPCDGAETYTVFTTGSGNGVVVGSPVASGARAFTMNGGLGANQVYASVFTAATGKVVECDNTANFNSFSFSYRIPTFTGLSGGASHQVGVSAFNGARPFEGAGGSNGIHFEMFNDGSVWARASVGAFSVQMPGITITPGTWYHFDFLCDQTLGVMQWHESTTDSRVISTIGGTPAFKTTPMPHFIANFYTAGASATHSATIDNIAYGTVEVVNFSEWCSLFGETDFGGDANADFGYNYVEGVDRFTTEILGSGGELDDGYRFQASDSNYDYMGKGWTPGADAAEVNFTVESGTDGADSVFRVAFSFETEVPSAVNKGNGDTTGSFETHIAARLVELGNDWRMSIYFRNGGAQTQIGPAADVYNPNSPTAFKFRVDPRSPSPYAAITGPDGADIINRSWEDFGGLAGLSSLYDNLIYSQWFVASGDLSLIGEEPLTMLDNNDVGDDADSTCIKLEGTNVPPGFIGSPGGQRNTPEVPEPTGTITGGPGSGALSQQFGLGATGSIVAASLTILGLGIVGWAIVTGGGRRGRDNNGGNNDGE